MNDKDEKNGYVFMRRILATIFIFGILVLPLRADCLMTSADYIIYADSIDAGGIFSSGGDYTLLDTIGESPAGVVSSASYEVRGGFQYMTSSSLSVSVSVAGINLGALSPVAVSSAASTVTVSTDSDSGYVLSVSGVSGTSVAAVSDGTVTAGSEEYGLSVSGPDSLFSGDSAITAGLYLASSSTPVMGSETALTFKASISFGSALGASYSQNVTLAASVNL